MKIKETIKYNSKYLFTIMMFSFTTSLYCLIPMGSKIPYFKISDTEGKTLTPASLQGKLTVGFYTDKDAVDKNKSFEESLLSMKKSNSHVPVFSLAVTDTSTANSFTKPFWEKAIRKKEDEKDITIYCDWDGNFKKAFNIPEKESTFLIIDKNGILKYIFTGKIPESEFEKIKSLIINLADTK